MGEQFAVLGHEGQFHQGDGGVGTLVVAELGFDVSKAHLVVKAFGGGLELYLVEHEGGETEDIYVGDILLGHIGTIVAAAGDLFKEGFGGRIEIPGRVGTEAHARHLGKYGHALGLGVLIRGEDQGRGSLTQVDPLGTFVEDEGLFIGQHTETLEYHHDGGVEAGIHTPGHDHIKITGLKAFDGKICGNTGGGTCGVYHEVGAVGSEEVGDASGDDVGEKTRGGVFVVLHEPFTDTRHEGVARIGGLNGIHAGGLGDVACHQGCSGTHDVLHVLLAADASHDDGGLVAQPKHLRAIAPAGLVDGLGGGIQGKELGPIDGFGRLGRDAILQVVEAVVGDDSALDPGEAKISFFIDEVIEVDALFR